MVHALALKAGGFSYLFVGNALIAMYGKCAHVVIQTPNKVLVNHLISSSIVITVLLLILHLV